MTEETPGAGHNSHGIAGKQLRAIIERIETLESEKKALSEDVKDIYAEAKGNGFLGNIIRKIIAIRKRDREELEEENEMIRIYSEAIDPFS